ncbi:hypothetical protein DOTSEDRAFT_48065 [Dothistroma septosporum NZE10]|uniref:RING-type domain-containing protein n=1 Tax=Dothistroma septosporum (strain NZE10 / CBS 128990) TaxID=675120 RepID=M2YL68_DOTSN|nr:hypothetical protein DOTSEDRAFT_48065 [Dothistroma septosporum NZE10]
MPGDGSYQTAEGSSRKRLKISRDAGRSAGLSKSPETVDLVTPAKPEPSAPMTKTEGEVKSSANNTCHHEQSLRSLHDDLDAMRQLITCKICQRFLYEPYALTCGHTFCYSCLSQWMGQNKIKTCPDCRTVIRDEPAPSYLIRELVLIFVGRSALLPDGETAEEHNQLAKEEADIVARDKANTHVETGGLFKGSFKKGTRRTPVEGIRDHSDNIYRCPECTSEVEDGRCSGCGIRVRTEEDDLAWSSDDASVDTDELELDHELEAEDYDDDTELGLIDGHTDVWDPYQQGHIPWHHDHGGIPAASSSDVDLSHDEHDEFMGGFIDDEPIRDAYWNSDEEEGDQSEATGVHNNAPQRRRRLEEVSESDVEEEEDEAPVQPRRRRELAVRVPRRLDSEAPSSAAASVVSDPSDSDRDDSEDDEDEEPIRTRQRNRGRRAPARSHRVVTVRSGDEDSDAETHATDQPGAGGFSPILPAPQQQHEHVNYYDDSDVESDGDDEEAEQEHDHDDSQHRDEYGNGYGQYGEDYGEDESDDGYDDQSTANGY